MPFFFVDGMLVMLEITTSAYWQRLVGLRNVKIPGDLYPGHTRKSRNNRISCPLTENKGEILYKNLYLNANAMPYYILKINVYYTPLLYSREPFIPRNSVLLLL